MTIFIFIYMESIYEDNINYFMSNYVMENQWGIGAMEVVSSPKVEIDDNFKEIRDDEMFRE